MVSEITAALEMVAKGAEANGDSRVADMFRQNIATVERLQREAAAGRKLYATLKRHHENDLLESQFTDSVERVLCAYEQRTGKAVANEPA